MKRKRIIVIILTVLFLLSLIFTSLYVYANAEHECIGEGCPVCAEIQSCEDFLKSAAAAMTVAAVILAVHKTGIVSLPFFYDRVYNTSLITLKVKLSN